MRDGWHEYFLERRHVHSTDQHWEVCQVELTEQTQIEVSLKENHG